jgi:hypothetical protein
MADRAVLLPTDPELVSLLRGMELDREALIEVVRFADRERALCTSNDVRGFDLITVNDKAARGLREVFCGKTWIKDETDNQAGIRNPRLGLRVIACNFDGNAGNPLVDPTNRVAKGAASRTKTRCNATGWLPGLPDIPPQSDSAIKTWVLGIFAQENAPLRAELSLPIHFREGRYARFSRRLVLLSGSEGPELVGREIGPDRGPVEIVDIAIKRK